MSSAGDKHGASVRRVLTDAASTAAAVRAARKRRGLTQQAVAEAAGVTRQSIVNLETGRSNPQLTTVVAALRVLGLRLEVAPIDTGDTGDVARVATRQVRAADDAAGADDALHVAVTPRPAAGPVDLDAVLADVRRSDLPGA